MPNQDLNPGKGQQGTSPLYDQGTSPNTRAAVSQKIRILAPAYGSSTALFQMGVLSSFNPSESRSIEPIRGIGYGDMIAENVPNVTDPMEASIERALLYLSNMWQATGYAAGIDGPVRSLRHHRWPFDIEQQIVFSTLADRDLDVPNQGFNGQKGSFTGGATALTYPEVTSTAQGQPANRGHTALITLYEACWWNNWSATFAADSAIIMESGSVTVTDVHDFSSIYGEFLATGNDPTIGELGSIRYGTNPTDTP